MITESELVAEVVRCAGGLGARDQADIGGASGSICGQARAASRVQASRARLGLILGRRESGAHRASPPSSPWPSWPGTCVSPEDHELEGDEGAL